MSYGGWFPRLSRNGRDLVSTFLPAPGDPRTTNTLINGVERFPGGYAGQFYNDNTVVSSSQTDGRLYFLDVAGGAPRPVPGSVGAGGSEIGAGGGRLAVGMAIAGGYNGTILDDGRHFEHFRGPSISPDGHWMALTRWEDEALFLLDLSVPNGQPFLLDARPCMNPRWGSGTLTWESEAQIFGISTVGQGITPLSFAQHQYKPVPIWTGRELAVLSHGDGWVTVQFWGTSQGYMVYLGVTDAPHDAQALDADHIRVDYSIGGVNKDSVLDLTRPRVNLALAVQQPPPLPQPAPTDRPWVAAPEGTPFDIRALWRASATAEQVVGGRSFLWFRKSDGLAGDPQGAWGAWFDHNIDSSATPVAGLWMDSSTGQILDPDTAPKNRWMTFEPNRLWFPLVGTSPWKQAFSTGFHWRDYASGKIDPEATEMRFEVGSAVIGGVEMRYRHTYDASTQDGYIEYSYYDAKMIERRWELWKNGVLVQATQPVPVTGKEAFVAPFVLPTNNILPVLASEPTPVPTPTPTPVPGHMPNFPQALWVQYRHDIEPTFLNEPAGDAKDDKARAYVKGFAEQVVYSTGDSNFGIKRADPGRPFSKDLLPYYVSASVLVGWDLFSGVGENVTKPVENPGLQDISGQSFYHVSAVNHLGGTSGPGVPTDPTVPVSPGVGGPSEVIFTAQEGDQLRYLTVEDGGGDQGDGRGRFNATRTQTDIDQFGTGWQTILVEAFEDGVSLKLGDRYASTWDEGDAVRFNRTSRGPGEKFFLVVQGSSVGIKDYRGKFLCVERDDKGITGVINANRDVMQGWESFTAKGLRSQVGNGPIIDQVTPKAPRAYPGLSILGSKWSKQIVGVTAGSAFSPGSAYKVAIAQYADIGFNLIRVFGGNLDWSSPKPQVVGDELYENARAVASYANDFGLLCYIAYVTNAADGYDLDKHVQRLRDAVAGLPNVVLGEVANESDHGTQGGRLDKNTLQRLRGYLSGAFVLSADIRDGSLSDRLSADFDAFHYERSKSPADLYQVRNALANLALFNQEPIGAAEADEPGKRSANVELFRQFGQQNKALGMAGVFHSTQGLNCQPLSGNQLACAKAFLQGSLS